MKEINTPCYIIDEARLIENGKILKKLQDETGSKILLAQKAFSNYDLYPVLAPYLAGTEASGLYEARLGYEEMPQGEVHVFCGAYKEKDIEELCTYADHIVFNSIQQFSKYVKYVKSMGREVGLRINPECSTQEGHEIYDPCSPTSRLGVTKSEWDKYMNDDLLNMLDGIHFHTLCEQDSDALEQTIQVVEEKFCRILSKVKWINFGGGHHITKQGYDLERLKRCIKRMQDEYGLRVYLEPGEAVALNAGVLVTEVLDIVQNGENKIAILDMSAACHTPDVIEMPYRPPLKEGYEPGEKEYTYYLGGPTCLAGDMIGAYSFEKPLTIGQRLVFEDMAIYTTCKNNTFNGMPLPSIYVRHADNKIELIRSFDYMDFKNRLGRL